MKNHDLSWGDAALVAVAGIIALTTMCAPDVGAQEAERLSPQLALARVCVSETGFDGSVVECAAIAAVLRNRFNGNIVVGAQAYSNRVFDRARRDPRAYIAFLRPDGREPEYWPRIWRERDGRVRPFPAWHGRRPGTVSYREQWLARYQEAGAIVNGVLSHTCTHEPDHWGARYGVDLERAVNAGWIEVYCGETANAFWRVPDLAEEATVDRD